MFIQLLSLRCAPGASLSDGDVATQRGQLPVVVKSVLWQHREAHVPTAAWSGASGALHAAGLGELPTRTCRRKAFVHEPERSGHTRLRLLGVCT